MVLLVKEDCCDEVKLPEIDSSTVPIEDKVKSLFKFP